jgi:hypothetical protein
MGHPCYLPFSDTQFGKCKQCSDNKAVSAVFVTGIVMVLLVVAVIVVRIRHVLPIETVRTVHRSAGEGPRGLVVCVCREVRTGGGVSLSLEFDGRVSRSTFRCALQIKIGVSMFQILASANSTYSIPWPSVGSPLLEGAP